MAEINLVPQDAVSFEEFSQFARRRGWEIDQRSVRAARHEESPEFLWRAGGDATVRLVQSATLDRSYLVVAGDDPGPSADAVREEFPTFSLAEIVERLAVARSDEDRRAALRLVAATGASSFDQTIYDAVRGGLEDSDSLVRLAALAAAFYLRWHQFRPLVERVSESPEAGENIRIIAGDLLGLTHWDRG
ncbi:hypothetical protein ACH4T9_19470 [Micromonospora sp. NPDC020750]|uniref:hypothetical protein n=1 Tax=unclassified Micromonospora TaxID=2617518 RepID=UPI0037AFE690